MHVSSSVALNAQLGCKLANVYDISSVYNTLLRQRYESDPRYTPKKPFKDPNTSYTLPKVCASSCGVRAVSSLVCVCVCWGGYTASARVVQHPVHRCLQADGRRSSVRFPACIEQKKFTVR